MTYSQQTRTTAQHFMRVTLADEQAHHDWIYEELRPMYVPPHWIPGQRVLGDCGKGCQYIAKWSDAPDPMNTRFGPFGNSQSIWMHLPHLSSISQLQVADIITFGFDGADHAAMVLEAGADPLLWSFGHMGAPNTYRLSWDRRPHQLCKLMSDSPNPKPTKKDLLRAETGFYAWVAWKLGEGRDLWLPYGPADPSVRPNVPAKISQDWWHRYEQFLLNRHQGNPSSAATPKGALT